MNERSNSGFLPVAQRSHLEPALSAELGDDALGRASVGCRHRVAFMIAGPRNKPSKCHSGPIVARLPRGPRKSGIGPLPCKSPSGAQRAVRNRPVANNSEKGGGAEWAPVPSQGASAG